ncbi:DNA replication protein psf1 [Rhodotorula mucilaginosa]|uniref:DNA replication complex GINS protein PSF1 n=1 Tax=Rhodotorula mucilaginosa TaxID=5537 RepID=A0A9P6W180_RHOMI|nr:DNA replication protein psf1 [Rhodotorula mucilaginosa]
MPHVDTAAPTRSLYPDLTRTSSQLEIACSIIGLPCNTYKHPARLRSSVKLKFDHIAVRSRLLCTVAPLAVSSRRVPSRRASPLLLHRPTHTANMLGDAVQQLVVESHRSQQTRSLLPYNTQQVRTVIRESHSLSQSITATAAPFIGTQGAQPTQGVSAELTIAALALNRNKRGLYVYHQQRVDVLKDKFWEHGGVLSAAFGSETETRRNMTTTDEVFAKGYADLCLAFKTSLYGGGSKSSSADPHDQDSWFRDLDDSDDDDDDDDGFQVPLIEAVDLLGGGTRLSPPKELMIDVRVLRDVGQVELLSGNRINLKQGLQYHLARDDVEAMIVSGDVEVIE